MPTMLPESFARLEPWTAWCLSTETERNRRRLGLEMDDLKAFADAMLPEVEAVTQWIDAHQVDGKYDPQTLNLFYMLLSLAEAASAIESYDPQVAVVDGYDSRKFVADEHHRLRPAI